MSKSTRNDAREQILDPTISKTSLAVGSRMLSVLKIAQACVSISPEARLKMKNVVTDTSDYFQDLYDLSVELIQRGQAYVDHQVIIDEKIAPRRRLIDLLIHQLI